jgi:hypothetical protein
MKTSVLCVAVAAIAPAHAFVGSSANLPMGATRAAQTGICATSMSQDGRMGRRAALLTTLITGASVASKADAAGLNLMPPALQDLKDGAAQRTGKGEAPARTSGKSLFEDKLKPPSFSVPKLGPQKKSKKAEAEADAGAGDEAAPAPKPKSKMSMPKFGQKAAKKEEEAAPAPKAEKPASDAPAKPRKLKQAGMSGKEDERFKSDTVDSLEEKLRKRKSKADEQLEEIKSKVGEKDFDEVPNLNPFGGKK